MMIFYCYSPDDVNFDANDFQYATDRLPEIENKLVSDGYVRIQFCENDLPTSHNEIKEIEEFFVDFITKLGCECLTHNADEKSFVWHVRPMACTPDIDSSLARSHTDHEFPFHTDCSYESNPPEYMALLVLEQDQLGGGQFEVIQMSDVIKLLSEESRKILAAEDFKISVPLEFRKAKDVDHIYGSIMLDHHQVRYRPDILLGHKCHALDEFESIISQVPKHIPKLEKYTMILLNNRKYLHARTKILDPRRHLLRIRFNRRLPYNIFSIYNEAKLRSEYLTLPNTLLDYFQDQHSRLYKTLKLIIQHYNQTTEVGAEIRRTFQFEPKIHDILCELNIHRPEFVMGNYRPDILFTTGHRFRMNGKLRFEPKICEINARFAWNGYLLAAAICPGDNENQISVNFDTMLNTICESSQFDTTKSMTILKSKEHGFDIHLFQKYWINKYHQNCCIIHPDQLHVVDGQLFDQNEEHPIQQMILELHQDEILALPEDIVHSLIHSSQIRYMNDLRTIFLVHDKRMFSLLSNQAFLNALWQTDYDQTKILTQLIPTTYVIGQMPSYVRECVLAMKNNWCIKPNLGGKGENMSIGTDASKEDWSHLLFDPNHQEWIVQQYQESVQYTSMNLSGMLFCCNDHCFNIGPIRLSPNKIVNICNGGCFIRPFVHRRHVHCSAEGEILTKTKLHEQLQLFRLTHQQWNQNIYFSSSGGSGGKRLFFATDIQENQRQREILVDMMLAQNVLSETDVCLNLFHSNNIYRSLEIFNDFCSLVNCTVLPMGSDVDDAKILQIIDYFRPNVIMGSPYRLMQLALFIEEHRQSNEKFHFEKIFFACEPLDNLKRDYFKRIYNCSMCLGFYGSAETGVFACQTPAHATTQLYMYPKELVQVEIVNRQIIVTNVVRRRNQLIRFNTSDLGRLIPTQDNEKYGLVEVQQSQRLINLAPAAIMKSDVEECMNQFDLIEWQLIIENDPRGNNRTMLTFYYVEKTIMSSEYLKTCVGTYLKQCLGSSFPIEDSFIIRFEPILYQALIRDQTSNKLLKIIDRRF
ncbi:unnamed protein product [Rotaria socialis]|uniref:TauD/TfdA-like domain-containing protein n=1 Tax=Rotaria socialis TaxID=392032 RepID=A0A818CSC6_9BILA|nr:unnamed protein product [Rotaria socialis]